MRSVVPTKISTEVFPIMDPENKEQDQIFKALHQVKSIMDPENKEQDQIFKALH